MPRASAAVDDAAIRLAGRERNIELECALQGYVEEQEGEKEREMRLLFDLPFASCLLLLSFLKFEIPEDGRETRDSDQLHSDQLTGVRDTSI